MMPGAAASNRILLPTQAFRRGRTGGELLWQRLVDDWKAHGLPLLTEDECPSPTWFGDQPLPVAFWYWSRFAGSRNSLVVVDHSRSGRVGLLLRALKSRPTVRILLVVNHLNERFRYGNRLYTRLARNNETTVLRMADRIVVHTRAVADAVRSRGVDGSRLTLVPLGLHKVETTVPVRDLSPTEPLKLLWVGGDFIRKGLLTLLEALEACPSPRPILTVVGSPHSASIQNTATAEVRSRNLEDHVAFLGRIPDDRLAALWSEHDVYVQPSLLEGHGLALDEALIRGMPGLASDLPAFRERLAEGDVCFVPPGDAAALAEELVRLRSGSLRRQLAAAARKRAATFPSWSDTLTAYRDLVAAEFDTVRRK